ncbi:protein NipSnap homolog 3A isoform X5 [Heterocephalus glaber]|uniref:Protein NipSnap homolog 3A isoform X5 n=1 Tax=Heterocephalus glaber TaxID=10181 RepID=A0AAX6T7U7_HETGA|nr:protein NipSnap homolog 3A isoform X5 [Heterocephalus glaber]
MQSITHPASPHPPFLHTSARNTGILHSAHWEPNGQRRHHRLRLTKPPGGRRQPAKPRPCVPRPLFLPLACPVWKLLEEPLSGPRRPQRSELRHACLPKRPDLGAGPTGARASDNFAHRTAVRKALAKDKEWQEQFLIPNLVLIDKQESEITYLVPWCKIERPAKEVSFSLLALSIYSEDKINYRIGKLRGNLYKERNGKNWAEE